MSKRSKIRVIGAGPGAPIYLLPIALEKAKGCDLLVGSKRALHLFQGLEIPHIELTASLSSYLPLLGEESQGIKGVVVAGDPGFYSLLAFLRKYYSAEELEVIPGISSVQYLFARLARPWQEYSLISYHGRQADDLIERLRRFGKVVLLTDRENNPAKICQTLLGTDFENNRVVVGENLSYSDEKITIASVREVSKMRNFAMSVVIIEHEE